MANPEHLALLGDGAKAWEKFRRENPATQLDLSGANLGGFTLPEMHLIGAIFHRANLSNAILTKCRLDFADFTGAHLYNTDFRASDLSKAKFIDADLTEADLSYTILDDALFNKSNLSKTNFTRAHIKNTDFKDALFSETIIVDTSLLNADNIDTVEHRAPSVIDHRTLQSSGNLPINFLRGCGLPDIFIDYLPSLINQPIQYHSCFISYSNNDDSFARRLYADLQNNGVRCWFAPEDMKIGDKFRSRIDEVIHVHEKLLLVLSKDSIKSPWVEKEVETAFDNENSSGQLMLFPIRLDDTVMQADVGWAADIRRIRHIGDFTKWKDHDFYIESFDRLLKDLKALKD